MGLDITLIAPPSGTTYTAGTTSVSLWASGSVSIDVIHGPVFIYTKGDGMLSSHGDGKLFIVEV